jgi:hypothetical protein
MEPRPALLGRSSTFTGSTFTGRPGKSSSNLISAPPTPRSGPGSLAAAVTFLRNQPSGGQPLSATSTTGGALSPVRVGSGDKKAPGSSFGKTQLESAVEGAGLDSGAVLRTLQTISFVPGRATGTPLLHPLGDSAAESISRVASLRQSNSDGRARGSSSMTSPTRTAARLPEPSSAARSDAGEGGEADELEVLAAALYGRMAQEPGTRRHRWLPRRLRFPDPAVEAAFRQGVHASGGPVT